MFKQQLPMFGLTANVDLNVFNEIINKIKLKYHNNEIIVCEDQNLDDYNNVYINNVFKYLRHGYVSNVNPIVKMVKVLLDSTESMFSSDNDTVLILGFENGKKYRIFILIQEDLYTFEIVKAIIELYIEYGKLFEDCMIFDDCNFLAYKAYNLYLVRLIGRQAELNNVIGDAKNDSDSSK